jgi:RHH-type proline utilization regulon transcriptional repressor/proline dehydrogenase/delta 1-pyrroline-5-carboxylate dehydrogenase
MYALSSIQQRRAAVGAATLIAALRAPEFRPSPFEQLFQQFSLSTREGVALMALAEALLRVPDDATALALLKRTLSEGDWTTVSAGAAARWPRLTAHALDVGGRLVGFADAPANWLQRLGAPVALSLARRAMRCLGGQFILGGTLDEALRRSRRTPGGLFSYDLLGEGARTLDDAHRYRESLFAAIATLGAAAGHNEDPHRTLDTSTSMPLLRRSLSLKLSALEPRYEEAQRATVLARLVPTLRDLCEAAAAAGVNLTLDAEEQERLELSLDVLAGALDSPRLAHWTGAGLAVQAYGTRAHDVIDEVADLARRRGACMHVRLVKGAYWDSEIKRAQERGLDCYPVYTRQAATDLSYLAAVERLFEHSDVLWPQFATHNPYTLCAVREIAAGRRCEFQRLHGMGERVYRAAARLFPDQPPVRVYAPVGDHTSLLPYLVRRLLENGANTSIFAQTANPSCDNFAVEVAAELPLPTALFAGERRTARAWDLGRRQTWEELGGWYAVAKLQAPQITGPCVCGEWRSGETITIASPGDRSDVLGHYRSASGVDARQALAAAHAAQLAWSREPADTRARCLERAADLFEAAAPELLPLLVREAGKCWPEAIAELREGIDFCRYYAVRGRELGRPQILPGPTGETNILSWHGRGVFYCIAPWNFPFAIFTGQVVAALAAGCTVLAKPAPQTPLIAAAVARILFEAGVPAACLHYLPGDGREVSNAILWDSRLGGVAFTGSTVSAQAINGALAMREGPIIPFIAETGGVNAMIVDSTALVEQVVDDVITSAFRAAGQRCSSLRLLCVQEDIAERVLSMLRGAMDALVIGDPADPATDLGPLIDADARARVQSYLGALPAGARIVHQVSPPDWAVDSDLAGGHFVGPALIELGTVGDLTREIFGPVLHVVRFAAADLPLLLAALDATDFGLTLGIHTRLSERARDIAAAARVGNIYVNRNMVGAVVGVQPFGGEGLSGTGPKAGGPHYLQRFAVERVVTTNDTAWGGNLALLRGSVGSDADCARVDPRSSRG